MTVPILVIQIFKINIHARFLCLYLNNFQRLCPSYDVCISYKKQYDFNTYKEEKVIKNACIDHIIQKILFIY